MDPLFKVHILNETGKGKAMQIAHLFDTLTKQLRVLCPQGRELSIALTKLEESCFFAKRAMADQEENQAK